MEAEVVYLCKRTAVSSLSMWPGELRRLSVLDCTMEPYSLRAVYYYPRCPPTAGTISKLKESLAELLNTYRPVAGRLHRTAEGRWAIKCNEAGVRMVEATAKGSVEEWLQKDMYRRSDFWSTFYIQLTQFERGGLAIGISCAHMQADAACLSALVTAWADMNLLGKMLSPPCFHPLPPPRVGGSPTRQHSPSRPLVDHYASSMESEIHETGRFATATFAFSDETVKSILAEAQVAGDSTTSPRVFAALAALFWAAVSRAKGKDRGLVDMAVCMDAREALNLSKSFFGNAMVFAGVRGGEIGGGRLEAAAKAIADATKAIDYEGVTDLMENGWACAELCSRRLLCANWEGLDPHLATFEQGVGPIHVSYYLEPKTLGRVVAVTLPEAQLGRLRVDGHILGYQTKIHPNDPSRANI
ncbi:unnamed protein product [Spirodela intermedia]|uniref:Uncharacterized protein n=1 Tax=Spirodela intermedia TaxID=51605 RepID=A0A7I8IUH9_SPIIN|nr:unnamed protein product [Spirodela intermedia]CAA6660813.1 unnamed protein product [Spirodela intermedia]